jgi:hypothetical protein
MEAEPASALAKKDGRSQRSASLFRYRDQIEEIQEEYYWAGPRKP